MQIDPRMVSASVKTGKTVAVLDAGASPQGEAPSLWHSAGAFFIGPQPPVPDAVRLATGQAPPSAGAPALAVVGVTDEGGMLFYVELEVPPAQPSAADGKMLSEMLKRLGCSSRLLLTRPFAVALGGDTDLAGTAVRSPSGPTSVRLSRVPGAGARRMFEDTPVVPLDVWYPLQQKRIRYFKKPQAETPTADDNN